MLNGLLWARCSGACWRVCRSALNHGQWPISGFVTGDATLSSVLRRLHVRRRDDGYIDLNTWMIDSTTLRATRAASGGGKKGEPSSSCGGVSTTLHMLCDTHGIPLAYSGHQASVAMYYYRCRCWRVSAYPAPVCGAASHTVSLAAQ